MHNTPISIYIAPKYMHYDLRKQYMKKHNTNSFKDVFFLTLEYFLEQYETQPKVNTTLHLIEMYHLLSKFPANIFREVLLTPSFLKELQRVMNILIDNNVGIDDFPQDTPSRKELRTILMTLRKELPFSSDYQTLCIHEILQHPDFSHVCLVNFVPANKMQKIFLDGMMQRGAIIKNYHLEEIKHNYHYALNIRQEVEACAQNIVGLLQQNISYEDIAIAVSDLHAYTPFMKHVFSRYQLPYFITDEQEETQLIQYFHSILAYVEKPSVESLLHFISHPLLGIENVKELTQYVELCSLSYTAMFEPFDASSHLNDYINPYTKDVILKLEIDAQIAQNMYLSLLADIDQTSFSSILLSSYQLLVKKQNTLTNSDISYAQNVRSTFQSILESLDSLPLSFACQIAREVLAGIRLEVPRKTNAILVSDLTRPFLPVTYGFALGLYQATYPNFKPLSGILDETIASLIPEFELLSTRYQRHIDAKFQNLHFATNTIFSYPQGNFEGKVYESSLDLELQFQLPKATAWPFKENDTVVSIEHTLDSELARELFVVNNELVGSISRFENYFRCPYSYFLKYGLKLQEPVRFDLKEAEIGQLLHGFFEEAVTKFKKQYTNMDEQAIHDYVSSVLAPYAAVFKEESHLFDIIKEQLQYLIHYNLEQLRDIEEHTSFEPSQTEVAFDEVITQYEDIAIRLKGIIDRVDEIAHGFRILDYKSSARSLRLSDFYAGLSLQLITYSYITARKLNKKPFGCYYVNLAQSSMTHIPYSIDRRKKESNYQSETAFLADNQIPLRLRGLTFVEDPDDLSLLDDSYRSIIGLSYRKSGKNPGPTVRNPANFEELAQDTLSLYEELGHRVLSGNIALTPVEGACNYCPFKVICHFHGKSRKPKPVIIRNITEGEDA